MTEPTSHKQSSPAVAFLRKNGVVLGLTAVLVLSVGAYVFNSSQPERTAAVAPRPSIQSTASVGGGVIASGTATDGAQPTAGAAAGPSEAAGASGASQSGAGTAGGSTAQQAGGAGVATTKPVPQTTVTLGAGPQAPPVQDWEPVAKAFAAAWAKPEAGKDAWLAGMKPYVTPALYSSFTVTDLRAVPSDVLTDVVSDRHSERSYIFTPRYSSGTDRFTASIGVQTDGSWLVDGVTPPEK